MKYTTIVFDCDGTLLDTATDLANAVNHVLRTHNFPEKSLAEVKAALGNAVTYLMRQCLPSTVADHELEPYIDWKGYADSLTVSGYTETSKGVLIEEY